MSHAPDQRTLLDDLPGDLMIWVLIVSELLAFGAFLAVFLAVRLTDPAGFAADQDHLHRAGAGFNTVVLVTSGWMAALGARAADSGRIGRARRWLAGAASLGLVFLAVKAVEYAEKAAQGIGIETSPFFTFYYLITGFHAFHVAAGIVVLAIVGIRARATEIEDGVAFWHMVDLVWVLVFPVVYLLR